MPWKATLQFKLLQRKRGQRTIVSNKRIANVANNLSSPGIGRKDQLIGPITLRYFNL